MSKPRLLVPMSLQFSVRYLLRSGLLSQISDFAQPVILLGWADETLGEGTRTSRVRSSLAAESAMGSGLRAKRAQQ